MSRRYSSQRSLLTWYYRYPSNFLQDKPGESSLLPASSIIHGSATSSNAPSVSSVPKAGDGSLNAPIDVDSAVETAVITSPSICAGLVVKFPPGKSPNSIYPTALHDHLSLPWGYTVHKGVMSFHVEACMDFLFPGSVHCSACKDLKKNTVLDGILK